MAPRQITAVVDARRDTPPYLRKEQIQCIIDRLICAKSYQTISQELSPDSTPPVWSAGVCEKSLEVGEQPGTPLLYFPNLPSRWGFSIEKYIASGKKKRDLGDISPLTRAEYHELLKFGHNGRTNINPNTFKAGRTTAYLFGSLLEALTRYQLRFRGIEVPKPEIKTTEKSKEGHTEIAAIDQKQDANQAGTDYINLIIIKMDLRPSNAPGTLKTGTSLLEPDAVDKMFNRATAAAREADIYGAERHRNHLYSTIDDEMEQVFRDVLGPRGTANNYPDPDDESHAGPYYADYEGEEGGAEDFAEYEQQEGQWADDTGHTEDLTSIEEIQEGEELGQNEDDDEDMGNGANEDEGTDDDVYDGDTELEEDAATDDEVLDPKIPRITRHPGKGSFGLRKVRAEHFLRRWAARPPTTLSAVEEDSAFLKHASRAGLTPQGIVDTGILNTGKTDLSGVKYRVKDLGYKGSDMDPRDPWSVHRRYQRLHGQPRTTRQRETQRLKDAILAGETAQDIKDSNIITLNKNTVPAIKHRWFSLRRSGHSYLPPPK